jgi:hypothetical protein
MRMRRLVCAQLEDPVGLDDVCARAGYEFTLIAADGSLNRAWAFRGLLNASKLEIAKALLSETDLHCSRTIAGRMGYASPGRARTCISRIGGALRPSNYKEALINQYIAARRKARRRRPRRNRRLSGLPMMSMKSDVMFARTGMSPPMISTV